MPRGKRRMNGVDRYAVNIADIAKMAGVSKTAVSFALNDKPGISREKRERVLEITRRYGAPAKRPSRADGAASGSSDILTLVCSRTDITKVRPGMPQFYSELLQEIERAVNKMGCRFWLRTMDIDESFAARVSALLSENRVCGVLLIASDMLPEDLACIAAPDRNLVVLDSYFEELDVNCVVMDNFLGGYNAARYLVGLGHRRIGYVQSVNRIYNFRMRRAGFERALAESGLDLGPADVFDVSPTVDAVFAGMSELLRGRDAGDLPTAFFAENDYIALGLIKCLQNSGLRVPEDCSVIGFDDIESSKIVTPELTTIHVPKDVIGSVAVRRLAALARGESAASLKVVVATRLVERGSCRPLAGPPAD